MIMMSGLGWKDQKRRGDRKRKTEGERVREWELERERCKRYRETQGVVGHFWLGGAKLDSSHFSKWG